jgi:ParB-like chromosome segregation protein Spo0J
MPPVFRVAISDFQLLSSFCGAFMKIETVPIDTIHADPANVRKHSQRNLDAIAASLARFGQQKPVVVDAQGIIRAGNGTFAAARALGWKQIKIVRTGLQGADAVAYAIADNRTTDLSQWDKTGLAQQWAALDDELKSVAGFDDNELKALLEKLDRPIGDAPSDGLSDLAVPEMFQVVVECRDEADQQELFTQLKQEGRKCRVLTL